MDEWRYCLKRISADRREHFISFTTSPTVTPSAARRLIISSAAAMFPPLAEIRRVDCRSVISCAENVLTTPFSLGLASRFARRSAAPRPSSANDGRTLVRVGESASQYASTSSTPTTRSSSGMAIPAREATDITSAATVSFAQNKPAGRDSDRMKPESLFVHEEAPFSQNSKYGLLLSSTASLNASRRPFDQNGASERSINAYDARS